MLPSLCHFEVEQNKHGVFPPLSERKDVNIAALDLA